MSQVDLVERAVADLDEVLLWLEAPQRRHLRWSQAEEQLLKELYGRIPRPELARRVSEVLRRETGLPTAERTIDGCVQRAFELGLKYSGEPDEYYLLEAARACGLSYEIVHKAAQDGKLPTRRTGKMRYVKQVDLACWFVALRERLHTRGKMLDALDGVPLVSKQKAMALIGLGESHTTRYLTTGVITAWQLPNQVGDTRPGEWLVELPSLERFIAIRAQGRLKELLDSNPAYVALRAKLNRDLQQLRRAGRLDQRDPLTTPASRYHPGCFTVAQLASHTGLSVQSLHQAIRDGKLTAVAVPAGGRKRYAIEPAEARRWVRHLATRGNPVAGWHNRRRRDIAAAGLLTSLDLAERWQVGEATVTRYAQRGRRGHPLPHRRWGRYLVFEPADVEQFEIDTQLNQDL